MRLMICSNSAPLQRSSTRSLVSTSRSWRRSPAQPNRTLGRNFENLPRRSHVTPDQCTTRSETKTVDNVHTQFRPPAIRLRRRHLKEIMAAKTTVTWSGMRLWGTSGAVLLSSAAPTPPVRIEFHYRRLLRTRRSSVSSSPESRPKHGISQPHTS